MILLVRSNGAYMSELTQHGFVMFVMFWCCRFICAGTNPYVCVHQSHTSVPRSTVAIPALSTACSCCRLAMRDHAIVLSMPKKHDLRRITVLAAVQGACDPHRFPSNPLLSMRNAKQATRRRRVRAACLRIW